MIKLPSRDSGKSDRGPVAGQKMEGFILKREQVHFPRISIPFSLIRGAKSFPPLFGFLSPFHLNLPRNLNRSPYLQYAGRNRPLFQRSCLSRLFVALPPEHFYKNNTAFTSFSQKNKKLLKNKIILRQRKQDINTQGREKKNPLMPTLQKEREKKKKKKKV